MNKYLLVAALVLGGCVVALLLWINSEVGDQYQDRQELIEGGKLKRKRSDIPEGRRPRVRQPRRSAKEIVLSVRLPEDDARAHRGGPYLLLLRGNRVLFRRPDPARPEYRRSILKNAQMDALLGRAAALATRSAAPATPLCVEWLVEGGSEKRFVGEADWKSLLGGTVGENDRAFEPEAAVVHLATAEAPTEEAPRRPWPLRRTPPSSFVVSPTRLEARTSTITGLLEAQAGEIALGSGPDDRREHYRVLSVAVELR